MCRYENFDETGLVGGEWSEMRMTVRKWFDCISWIGIVLMAVFCICLWKMGIFSSQENLKTFIAGFGMIGGLVFVLIQIVQVVIPIIPGGVSCLAGVLLFGAGMGFLYNYIGICIGSILAFLIAKAYGRPLLEKMFQPKLIEKYESWTQTKNRFAKLFAVAIFLPVAPDDFLCYLAGTTNMSLKLFTAIILLGKPCSIAAYSLGLTQIFKLVSSFA